MAGGTFTAQNKKRPGAYINFTAVHSPQSEIGNRGILTMPVAMSWGPDDEVIELFSTDLADGKSLAKIGYDANDEESLIYRLALMNCYKVLLYRLDVSGTVESVNYGVKATAEVNEGALTAVAKYKGICGNSISVRVEVNSRDSSKFDVVTLYKLAEKDRQTVTAITELVGNDWVDWSGAGSLVVTATAGVTLAGGVNGIINASTYTSYLTKLESYKFDTMAIPQDTTTGTLTTVPATVIAKIKSWNEDYGKKCQAVLYNATDVDYEGIITTTQGYKTVDEEISPATFVAYVGGLTAGSQLTESNTYHVIQDAIEIINPLTNDEIINALQNGILVLSTRSDGAIVVEQDINTLVTYGDDKSYAFSKNRVIRTLFSIHNDIRNKFETSYIGKVNNDDSGRTVFKADIIGYMNTLQTAGAIRNFSSGSDISVSAGDNIDSVIVTLAVQPVDSMEKLYMTVLVG